MEYLSQTGAIETLDTACLIIGIYQDAPSASFGPLPMLGDILQKGDFTAKNGQTQLLYETPGINAARILLLGLGKREAFSAKTFSKAVTGAIQCLQTAKPTEAVLLLPDLGQPMDLARAAVMAAEDAVYQFDVCKTEVESPDHPLEKLGLYVANLADSKAFEQAIRQAKAIADGVRYAKDLSNLPGNLCTPTYLAEQANELGRRHANLDVSILEEAEMEALGMGALLSVSRGSRQPAKLIVMQYRGGQSADKPTVLVGKGLTFDAGGISLKPAAKMDEMKYDMCGGASVFGVIQACAELDLPINLIGIVPSSENLPDGDANKPGDIVTSLSGQTIEVLNTDAEGRLILCDALTYAERFKPEWVIDIATLTGACIVALGHHASGLMGNDDALVQAISQAGEAVDDPVWTLPLWDDYAEALRSNFADVANVGDRAAGTITAGLFLSRFTKGYRWAHLDIAGTAWKSGKAKGATGRPVPLLMAFLMQHNQ